LAQNQSACATSWRRVQLKEKPDIFFAHRPKSESVRKGAIALLQARLSDALDLEAQMKQAHWNVKGRDFQQLHELFDKVYGEVEDFVDILADRIATLGGIADGPRPRDRHSTNTLSR
jgi:hypothetical protein